MKTQQIPDILSAFHVVPYVVSLFLAFIFHQELNLGTWIKTIFTKKRISEYVKVLDCFPCWTFWTACAVTIGLALFGYPVYYVTPMAVYLSAVIIDKQS